MKKLKILVLVHTDLIPPIDKKITEDDRDKEPWITEYDVISTLIQLKHEVKVLGVYSDLQVIKDEIEQLKPHIVFNLMEEFHGDPLYDQNVVSYLELLKVPYTGCNPRGLILARDKSIAKKILAFHRIKSPKFYVVPKNKKIKKPSNINFPLIVKCLYEEASYGIAKASIVHSQEKLVERLDYIRNNLQQDAIVEEFIEGREYYVGVIGNYRLKNFPVWELVYENIEKPEKEIYSSSAKWNSKYRKRKGIKHQKANIDKDLETKIINLAKKTYKVLEINGYARMDFRVSNDGNVYLLEANPNPNIAMDDEFAKSANESSLIYKELLNEILRLGIHWSKLD